MLSNDDLSLSRTSPAVVDAMQAPPAGLEFLLRVETLPIGDETDASGSAQDRIAALRTKRRTSYPVGDPSIRQGVKPAGQKRMSPDICR